MTKHSVISRGGRPATPEGPFETGAQGALEAPPAPHDAGDFLELFEHLQREVKLTLGLNADQRELRMIIHL